LYDAILIKDNHLACRAQANSKQLVPREAIELARNFIQRQPDVPPTTIVEIEVDSLEQLEEALQASPDIVLLDNMPTEMLRKAVSLRDARDRHVQLEASGGVNQATLRDIAETGVDRISMGALTHSAINLDLGLDWTGTKL
jgi:nicotinate-nucleotide pyrophosphorylase (carboxylating)